MSPEIRLPPEVNRQLMRLPYSASCVRCGETNLLALLPRKVIRCYECAVAAWENHHLGGRFEGALVVRVPGNQHRLLSVLQDIGWRESHEPGSAYAVAFDRGALLGVRLAWTS